MLTPRTLVRCLLLLTLVAGCVEAPPAAPSCGGSRSRCIAQVSLGSRFACAQLRDRTVWCWGRNDESQLGYATTDLCPDELPNGQTRSVACHTFPFQVTGLPRSVRVAAGGAFACALGEDQALRCWGGNSVGQLGNGLTRASQTPVVVRGLAGVSAFSAGSRHACAVVGTRVFCWGATDRGQLGLARASRMCTTPDGDVPCEPDPVEVPGVEGVTSVVAGAAHTCVRTNDGLAVCWGDNRYGQLGFGAASEMPGPTPRSVLAGDLPLEAIRALTAGPQHTCAITETNEVWCWGRNDHGETGNPPSSMVAENCAGPCEPRPLLVRGLPRRPQMPDSGVDASSPDARVEDVPRDVPRPTDAGEPGDGGNTDDREEPPTRDVLAPPSMLPYSVSAGGSFACALLEDGTVRCWGDNSVGQLGNGRTARDPQGAVAVIATPGAALTNPLQSAIAVTAGSAATCALIADGSLRCWGSNQSGALGNGTTTSQPGPVPVTW